MSTRSRGSECTRLPPKRQTANGCGWSRHTRRRSAVAAASAALVPAQPAAAPLATAQRPRAVEIPDYLRAGSWWRSSSAVIGLATVVLIGTAIVFASGLRGWLGHTPSAEPLIAQKLRAACGNLARPVPRPLPNLRQQNPRLNPRPIRMWEARPRSAAPPQPLTPGLATACGPPRRSTPTNSTEPDRYATASQSRPPLRRNRRRDAAPPSAESTCRQRHLPRSFHAAAADSTHQPPARRQPATSLAASATDCRQPRPRAATPSSPAASMRSCRRKQRQPAAPPDSGTYMGGKTVLLRYDDKAGTWFRVEPRAAIVPGQRVLSLPEFRPKIALSLRLAPRLVRRHANRHGRRKRNRSREPTLCVRYHTGHRVGLWPRGADQSDER